MSGPISTLASTHGRAGARRRRAWFFLHEPLRTDTTSGLRVGVIADGTTRGGPNGVAEGARRVVEHAERCAERGDVELLAVFIMSPKNLLRRKRAFFAALHAEFLRLLEGVSSGRLLSGVQIEIHGRLDRLRSKGGAAGRLADVADLLRETTEALSTPRLRLLLCLDYPEDSPVSLRLDVLVRTGMEEPSVLRLSGLRVRPDTFCTPSTRLWRDFRPADLDLVLESAPRAPRVDFEPGFSTDFVRRLAVELTRSELDAPVRVTLPTAATRADLRALVERMAAEPRARPRRATLVVGRGLPISTRRAGRPDAVVELELVPADSISPRRVEATIAWIVPGQPTSGLRLADRAAGDANIHGCEPTPRAIAAAIRRALRFHERHPPLHGAPRSVRARRDDGEERIEGLLRHVAARSAAPTEVITRELGSGGEPATAILGEVFAVKCLLEARAAGLMSGEIDWQRQGLGYGLTAFAIGYRPSPADLPPEQRWEDRTRALAHVMLALAASDEEITDRIFDGEPLSARRSRLLASVDHLSSAVRGEARPAPDVPGSRVLAAIARTWESYFDHAAAGADPSLSAAVRRAAEALYRANLLELRSRDGGFEDLQKWLSAPTAAHPDPALVEGAPEPIAGRIHQILSELRGSPDEPRARALFRELRLLSRLTSVAPSIGAGCALLAMTATEPAAATPPAAVPVLLETAPLVDCYFRLANDLAFSDLTRGDRDAKRTPFTCLIPRGLRGTPRERACLEALHTALRTAAWLRTEVDSRLAALAELWPLAGRWWRRGAHFGRRVYEAGHYDRLTRETAATLLDEALALAAG